MQTIGLILIQLLTYFSWALILWVVVSWLVAFNVINPSHPIAQKMLHLLDRLMMPILEPLRRIIPSIGGIDITPLILIIGVQLLQTLIFQTLVVG